jgi:1,4-dihydroxy-2-naphthoyl-CoA hydrolase
MNWKTTDLQAINKMCDHTLMRHLGIEFTAIDESGLIAKMPVNQTTHQPMGLLHGGASVVLIESIASMGSALLCDLTIEAPVGLEVNANHIGSIKSGEVFGKARVIHQGKQTHVWSVDIINPENNKLICSGRITIMIIKKSE